MSQVQPMRSILISATAACMIANLLACSTAERSDEAQVATAGLTPVLGHWSDTTMDMPAIVADGEQWSGQPDRAALERTSRLLFGVVSDSFLSNASAEGAFPFAVATGVDTFGSGTLRVQFNLIGGATDQIAGLLFGLGPSGEYFYVRYNTRDGNVALWRFANGERQVIRHGEVHRQIPSRTWHELVVEVRGRQVRGYVAGDTTISVEHTLDAEPSGRVGVWVKRDAITAFRRFDAVAAKP